MPSRTGPGSVPLYKVRVDVPVFRGTIDIPVRDPGGNADG